MVHYQEIKNTKTFCIKPDLGGRFGGIIPSYLNVTALFGLCGRDRTIAKERFTEHLPDAKIGQTN